MDNYCKIEFVFNSIYNIMYNIMSYRRHRCPHNDFQDHLEISNQPLVSVTSYKEEYDEKHVDRQFNYYHADNLRMEGEFIGERRNDYTVTVGERAPVIKPEDNLKPEGDFIGRLQEEMPTIIERVPIIKTKDNLITEGEFESTLFHYCY
jgi:hypothetical protein